MTALLRRALLVGYHFPPLAGSSGIQRMLRFVQQLPQFGWQPLVLTAHPMAYERTSDDLLADVPAGTVVRRAIALDTARQLSLRGRYISALARPDRWMTWRFDAVRTGLQMIREHRPEVIWSTYPIATAHVIGAELQRRSGVPWIADFRDPMAQEGYPADPQTWQAYVDIERRTFAQAACALFTTPSAAAQYRSRYPEAAARIEVLENGYDEDSFTQAEAALPQRQPLAPGRFTLLHSGIVYPSERDPTALFQAMAALRAAGALPPGVLNLRFRAPVHDALLLDLAQRHGLQDVVEVLPPVDYRSALAEMLQADALLVMQAANCNAQIPAKLYEYLRAGRPVVGLADPQGDTAAVLRQAGITAIAALEDAAAIAPLLAAVLRSPETGTRPAAEAVRRASRLQRTAELTAHLERVARPAATARAA